jgi:hypothetical protein
MINKKTPSGAGNLDTPIGKIVDDGSSIESSRMIPERPRSSRPSKIIKKKIVKKNPTMLMDYNYMKRKPSPGGIGNIEVNPVYRNQGF